MGNEEENGISILLGGYDLRPALSGTFSFEPGMNFRDGDFSPGPGITWLLEPV